ncbi:hypothetical protein [Streptomyces cucumeris]|uniref:hypothetical protein n=1 Tax=Streptomyces cucumeris TaxID=2962890 RepID=UPI003D74F95A
MTFGKEWDELRAGSAAEQRTVHTRLKQTDPPGPLIPGLPDFSTSSSKKKTAVKALEDHVQPETKTANRTRRPRSSRRPRGPTTPEYGPSASAESGTVPPPRSPCPRWPLTYDQFLAAPKEARAIASLLRDVHDQFVRLHSELTSVVAEAKKAGMAVSGDGLARYDFSDCTEQEKFSIQYDPELRDTVAAWNQRIPQAVKAVDDADQGAKLALKAAVEHPDKPGTVNGFNAGAQGDIEKAEAKEATDLSKKLAKDGKLSAQDMEEMHRLFRDNQDQKAFSQTYLAGLGPEETAKINYKLSGLAHGDAKQDILAVQQGMAMSIASATKNPQDPSTPPGARA